MNALDIVILCILGFCLIRGIFRGLIKELSSIVGVVAGIYAARMYYTSVSNLLAKWISNVAYREIAGFFIIFCGILILVGIVGIIIKYLLKITAAGWLDRLLGSVFATVKAVLIVSVLLMVLTAFLPKGTAIVKESMMAPHVMMVSENMVKMIPGEMKQKFFDKFAEMKKAWKRI